MKIAIATCTDSSASITDYDDKTVNDFHIFFNKLGLNIEYEEITKWLQSNASDSGVQVFSDDEISDHVSHSMEHATEPQHSESEDDDDGPPCPVSNSNAAYMFEKCLCWLEHQPEVTVHNTSVLRELYVLAGKKRMDSIIQTKITKYFQ